MARGIGMGLLSPHHRTRERRVDPLIQDVIEPRLVVSLATALARQGSVAIGRGGARDAGERVAR
jgi:hypothetical protein